MWVYYICKGGCFASVGLPLLDKKKKLFIYLQIHLKSNRGTVSRKLLVNASLMWSVSKQTNLWGLEESWVGNNVCQQAWESVCSYLKEAGYDQNTWNPGVAGWRLENPGISLATQLSQKSKF